MKSIRRFLRTIRKRHLLIFLPVVLFLGFQKGLIHISDGADSDQLIRSGKSVVLASEKEITVRETVLTTVVKDAGENGNAVILDKNPDPDTAKKVDRGYKDYPYNQYVSDMISSKRSLPDVRKEGCKTQFGNMTVKLDTSVIIAFHNEAWTVLLRTIHSVLDRSPGNLLKEIILVDDGSDYEHIKGELDSYVMKYNKVKLLRMKKSEGLIRARSFGAKKAQGEVLTFLDSACEVTPGWLEPLLHHISQSRTAVAVPIMDTIHPDTFQYISEQGGAIGFTFELELPFYLSRKLTNPAEPYSSPIFTSGLFSIDKKFYNDLSIYSSNCDLRNPRNLENIETSIKIWMCGGSVDMVPCSHVGYVSKKMTSEFIRRETDATRNCTVRMAEVWLDDDKKFYYESFGNYQGQFGNVDEGKALRQRLGCKSFQWYLENVYPELYNPRDSIARGRFRNVDTTQCLDSWGAESNYNQLINLWPCHEMGGPQYWILAKSGEIRRDKSCIDVRGNDVILNACNGGISSQKWEYDSKNEQVIHSASKKCMSLSDTLDSVLIQDCNVSEKKQQWKIEMLYH